jgi:3-hydroxyisobutyrate dehydrogenase-like beta-hydroxyacid dehydrogenase
MAKETLGRLGVIGLGMVGRHFASHARRASGAVTVLDLDPARMAAVEGAEPAASAAALAAGCDALVLSLPSPDAVRAAMLGEDGVLSGTAEGLLVIDTSTIDPDSCVAIHDAAAARGVAYVEAPISGGEPGEGGTDGAKAGSVSFMVGGDADAYERARPILHAIGKRSFHLGPAGSGARAKLISNHIAGLNNLVMMEGFVLGAAAGFSPETLMTVFEGTDAKSFMMMDYFRPRYLRNEFEPGFAIDLMHKDHRLAGDLGERHGVPLPLNGLALDIYQRMREDGLGQRDVIETLRHMARLAGVEIAGMEAADRRKRDKGGA